MIAECISIDILNMEEVKGIDFYKLDLYSDEFNKKMLKIIQFCRFNFK